MKRTYHQPTKNQIFISSWDGGCTYYTIFESEEEKQIEIARLKKIDDEYKESIKAYLNSL